jgi:hypothetical protein
MRKRLLYLSVVIFLAALGLSWVSHGTGVIKNDVTRNIYIPKELTMPLQVKAAYSVRGFVQCEFAAPAGVKIWHEL